LILKAVRPFKDERDGNKERFIDDEYLFRGPATYIPRVEEGIKQRIESTIVLPNQALFLLAKRDTIDDQGNERKAGSSVNILD
jgi:major vault protein